MRTSHRFDRLESAFVLKIGLQRAYPGRMTDASRRHPHGFSFHHGRADISRRHSQLGSFQPARRYFQQGSQSLATDPRRPPALGQNFGYQRLAGLWLGQGVWWPGLERDTKTSVRRRMRTGRGAPRDSIWPGDGGPGDHGVWQLRATATLFARHRQRRRVVEPGLQRAGRRFRPGLTEMQG